MPYDLKKKKIFDEAYHNYRQIVWLVQKTIDESQQISIESESDHSKILCDLDIYLQGLLIKVALSSKEISQDSRLFITSLPDNYITICEKTKGYKRFVSTFVNSMEDLVLFNSFFGKAIKEATVVDFIRCYDDCNQTRLHSFLTLLEIILNGYAAIDDTIESDKHKTIFKIISNLSSLYLNVTQISKNNKKIIDDFSASDSAGMGQELSSLKELNNLVGLEKVKKEVLANINLLKINQLRIKKGLPELSTSKHMVFSGPPGTGKTTVARIIARIYKDLGILSKGQIIETDRSGLVAGYIGQTAIKVSQIVKRAVGGILFIDEAYSLSSGSNNDDYGREAIDTLVKSMEDYRDDLIVIVAGYTEPMKSFINSNPGLRSRFSKYIEFSNYSAEELFSIFNNMCNLHKFILSDAVIIKLQSIFDVQQHIESFGNARGVRNLFDRAIENQAARILTLDNPSDIEFRTITVVDINDSL